MGGLRKIADACDAFNEKAGRFLSILVLVLILVQFAIVVMSAVFHMGSIKLQESLMYINACMFLGGAGYTFLKDGHVRVDIFYREMPETKKARVNLVGTLALLFPYLAFIWVIGVPYVWASWSHLEGSFETSGLQIVYILKSFILLFAFVLTLQGFSVLIRSLDEIKKGKR